MNLPNWLFTSFLIFALCLSERSVDPAIGALPAQWNVFSVLFHRGGMFTP